MSECALMTYKCINTDSLSIACMHNITAASKVLINTQSGAQSYTYNDVSEPDPLSQTEVL